MSPRDLWAWGDQRREVWLAAAVAPLLAGVLGVYFLAAPRSAFAGPVYDTARGVMPLRWWGVLFLLKALFGVVGFLRRRWLGLYHAMVVGMALYLVWAVIAGYTAATETWTGAVGAALWGWAAFTHWLCRRSFLREYRLDGR